MNLFKRIIRKLDRLITPPLLTTVGTTNLSYRETWLQAALESVPQGHRILDAGAGELQYKKFCSHLDYVSQDFGQYTGNGGGGGLHFDTWDNSKLDIVSDIASIPEADKSFDAIMCIEVFEHIPHPVDALHELNRLLKPGGILIITAPFCSITHFAPYFYQTGYSRYFYEYWLEHLNYTIEDLDHNGNYFDYIAQELRRLPSIAEKYTEYSLSKEEISSTHKLLNKLEQLSRYGGTSNELLTYGLHVKARKRSSQ